MKSFRRISLIPSLPPRLSEILPVFRKMRLEHPVSENCGDLHSANFFPDLSISIFKLRESLSWGKMITKSFAFG